MKGRRFLSLTAALLAAAVLTACGAENGTEGIEELAYTESAPAAYDMAQTAPVAAGADMGDPWEVEAPVEDAAAEEESEAALLEEGTGGAAALAESGGNGAVSKKLIRNAQMELETRDYDTLLAYITRQTQEFGGYVETLSVSGQAQEGNRYAEMTLRVPQDKLDGLLDGVSGQSNVVYRRESVQDVTLQYVDLDTHKRSLLTERDRLLELLEKAETVSDLIEIESRLSEVRYQIESLEEKLRMIDDQVDYSTVSMTIREVKLYTPAEEKGLWKRMTEGFSGNVTRLIWDIEDLFVALFAALPYLLAWAAAILCVALLIRLLGGALRRRRAKKRAKKRSEGEREAAYEIVPDKEAAHETGLDKESAREAVPDGEAMSQEASGEAPRRETSEKAEEGQNGRTV